MKLTSLAFRTAAVAVAKGEKSNAGAETAFVPTGKPASVATFR